MIGRAPALHPGDLRLVRAVNKTELTHLHDVLVFPSTGDQDLPSMCSGGDLDGDDYTIIWDSRLFPAKGHRYEKCMSYVGPVPKTSARITLKHVYDFMIDFMKNDSLGQIANAHLAFAHDPISTLAGKKGAGRRALSDECLRLAELHSTAVDFPKTGVAAVMPKELYRESYPDFMGKPDSFISDTPLSHMYREVVSSTSLPEIPAHYDNTLCNVESMIDWIDFAREKKRRYDEMVRRLMNQYDIQDEAEVVTGFLLSYNQKFAGKNEYQMRTDIVQQYNIIRDIFRKEVEDVASQDEAGQPVSRQVADAKKDAIVAAMYDVTFDDIIRDGSGAMMSFPWTHHEILCRLSRQQSQRRYQQERQKLTKDGQQPSNGQLMDLLLDLSS